MITECVVSGLKGLKNCALVNFLSPKGTAIEAFTESTGAKAQP
jgi:hypothetical protein